MDLGIIIVSYNTRQLTSDCLDSVFDELAASDVSAAVWVVDNASSDGSAKMLAERSPQAILIKSNENLGFAGGNNLVMERLAASGNAPRYVLLLNSDTIVRPGAFRFLVSFLEETPQAAVAGARLYYGDGSFQHAAFRFPTLAMAFFDFWTVNHRLLDSGLNGRYSRRLYTAGEPFAIDHPLGAAMMVRWSAIEAVGMLDTDYFMYCEEIDWCMRLKAGGWSVYCVPQAKVTHLGGQSTGQFRDRMFVALWQSRFRLFQKHYSPLYRFLVRHIVRAGLRRSTSGVRRQRRSGELGEAESRRRLQAYREVLEL